MAVLATDCKTKRGINGFTPAARQACAEKLARDAAKGHEPASAGHGGGDPQCWKIHPELNQISGRKGAKAGASAPA